MLPFCSPSALHLILLVLALIFIITDFASAHCKCQCRRHRRRHHHHQKKCISKSTISTPATESSQQTPIVTTTASTTTFMPTSTPISCDSCAAQSEHFCECYNIAIGSGWKYTFPSTVVANCSQYENPINVIGCYKTEVDCECKDGADGGKCNCKTVVGEPASCNNHLCRQKAFNYCLCHQHIGLNLTEKEYGMPTPSNGNCSTLVGTYNFYDCTPRNATCKCEQPPAPHSNGTTKSPFSVAYHFPLCICHDTQSYEIVYQSRLVGPKACQGAVCLGNINL